MGSRFCASDVPITENYLDYLEGWAGDRIVGSLLSAGSVCQGRDPLGRQLPSCEQERWMGNRGGGWQQGSPLPLIGGEL